MIGIYKIENLVNGKIYIGQAVNIQRRIREHKLVSRYNNPKNSEYNFALSRAIRKYGLNNFSFDIIEECKQEELDDKERYWIKYYNSYNDGYNETIGGKKGSNKPLFKIYQYDLFGNYLNEYENIYEASEKTKTSFDGIRKSLSNNSMQKSSNGFQWRKEKFSKIESIYPKESIVCFSLTGLKIKEYSSIQEASYDSGDTTVSIKHACEHKIKATSFYRWRYKKEIKDLTQLPNEGIITGKNKKVNQYDLFGNFIQTFNSLQEAASCVNVHPNEISLCCEGKINSSGHYLWTYLGMQPNISKINHMTTNAKYTIYQYDLNNNFIQEHLTIRAAARAIGNENLRNGIKACCENKQKTSGGFKWQYGKKYCKK